jgi:aminobenzoyl-glutamate transport protein
MASPAAAPPAKAKAEKKGPGGFQRVLDVIERVGNKVPHPAILFLALCVAVIVLSQILYLADARVTTEVVQPPPAAVQ